MCFLISNAIVLTFFCSGLEKGIETRGHSSFFSKLTHFLNFYFVRLEVDGLILTVS